MQKLKIAIQAYRERRALRKIQNARSYLTFLLETTPRYWRVGVIGGGVAEDLGRMTAKQARTAVRNMGHSIAHSDLENAFIAAQPKELSQSD